MRTLSAPRLSAATLLAAFPLLHLAAADAPAGGDGDVTVIAGRLDAARNQIAPALGATTYDIGRSQIDAQALGDNAPFNQVLLRAPGVAQDSYGQVHVRGEHANLQYRINDVILPEGITGFGQELDTRFAQDVTLMTGALPAQYGLRTAGVVDIHTRSGSTAPGGRLGVYGGSGGTLGTSAQYGATVGASDVYVSASALRTALGIENPTSSTTAIHDDSDQLRGFGYASFILDPASRLSVILSGADNRFEVPDNPGQTPFLAGSTADSSRLDERQRERSSYAVAASQRTLPAFDYQVAGFVRTSAVRFHPDQAGDLAFNGVASAADLRSVALGAQLDSSLRLSDRHTLRGGASSTAQRATDRTSTLVFPVDGAGDPGPDPFAVAEDRSRWGRYGGAYLQDEWRVTPAWTVNAGARFDAVSAFTDEHQLSPRLDTTLEVGADTTLHLGYARYFTPPPLEAVPQETVAAFDGTTNAAADDRDDLTRDLSVLADGLFGSGLRKGFANTGKLPPYATVDLGAVYAVGRFTARVDVINAFDEVYEIRDGSGIGVGAPQFGARRGAFGGLSCAF